RKRKCARTVQIWTVGDRYGCAFGFAAISLRYENRLHLAVNIDFDFFSRSVGCYDKMMPFAVAEAGGCSIDHRCIFSNTVGTDAERQRTVRVIPYKVSRCISPVSFAQQPSARIGSCRFEPDGYAEAVRSRIQSARIPHRYVAVRAIEAQSAS